MSVFKHRLLKSAGVMINDLHLREWWTKIATQLKALSIWVIAKWGTALENATFGKSFSTLKLPLWGTFLGKTYRKPANQERISWGCNPTIRVQQPPNIRVHGGSWPLNIGCFRGFRVDRDGYQWIACAKKSQDTIVCPPNSRWRLASQCFEQWNLRFEGGWIISHVWGWNISNLPCIRGKPPTKPNHLCWWCIPLHSHVGSHIMYPMFVSKWGNPN